HPYNHQPYRRITNRCLSSPPPPIAYSNRPSCNPKHIEQPVQPCREMLGIKDQLPSISDREPKPAAPFVVDREAGAALAAPGLNGERVLGRDVGEGIAPAQVEVLELQLVGFH